MINKSMIRLSNDMTMGELIAIAYPANVFCVANAAAQTAQQEQNAIIFFCLFVVAIIECDSAFNLKTSTTKFAIMYRSSSCRAAGTTDQCQMVIACVASLVGWLPRFEADNKYQFALMGATQFVCSNRLHLSKFLPFAIRTRTHLTALIETNSLLSLVPNAYSISNTIQYSMAWHTACHLLESQIQASHFFFVFNFHFISFWHRVRAFWILIEF